MIWHRAVIMIRTEMMYLETMFKIFIQKQLLRPRKAYVALRNMMEANYPIFLKKF